MTAKKTAIIEKHKINANDRGSSDVQIALLTDRIASLSGHLKGNVKDHSSRRGLMRMVNQRKRLLAYLAKTSPDRYSKLVKELNLKQ